LRPAVCDARAGAGRFNPEMGGGADETSDNGLMGEGAEGEDVSWVGRLMRSFDGAGAGGSGTA